eukprot:12926473-Prorocentrum_lima.AAC.1
MWEETTFNLIWEKGSAAATYSVPCSHAQVSYQVNARGLGVRDQHAIRVPQVLPRYRTGTLSGSLRRLLGGLGAENEVLATLASCDAHRANLKCLHQLHCASAEEHTLSHATNQSLHAAQSSLCG